MANDNCTTCDNSGIDDRYACGLIYCQCIWGKRAWLKEVEQEQAILRKALASNQLRVDALTQQISRMEP